MFLRWIKLFRFPENGLIQVSFDVITDECDTHGFRYNFHLIFTIGWIMISTRVEITSHMMKAIQLKRWNYLPFH